MKKSVVICKEEMAKEKGKGKLAIRKFFLPNDFFRMTFSF